MGLEDIAKRNQVPGAAEGFTTSRYGCERKSYRLESGTFRTGVGTRSLEDIYFLLTNDIRTLHRLIGHSSSTWGGNHTRRGRKPANYGEKIQIHQELDKLG